MLRSSRDCYAAWTVKIGDRPTQVALETRGSLRRDLALALSGQSESIRNEGRGRSPPSREHGAGVNVLQADWEWPDGVSTQSRWRE